jgi:FolB domain-containing protein
MAVCHSISKDKMPLPPLLSSDSLTRFVLDGIDLELEIGINAFELGKPQKVSLTVSVEVSDALCHIADSREGLLSGYDYNHVYDAIKQATSERVTLIEVLAQRIADLLLRNPEVRACEIKVMKYRMWPEVATVAVSIRRSQPPGLAHTQDRP